MNSSKHTDLRTAVGAKFGAMLALALACALPWQTVMAQEMEASTDLRYQSAFQHYQAFADVKLLSWRASNQQVANVGGWKVYAKQARQPDPAPSSTGAKTDPATEAESAPASKESKHQHHRSLP